jgi:DNA repair photolyase
VERSAGSQSLRWKLEADEPVGLFPDERRTTRHVGTGEYRGLEFLHVNAKKIINTVPGDRLGFRYTINPYRGCSHACVYCAEGSTPVLMADGRAKPLAEIRAGDSVIGTEVVGNSRRYVTSSVLDHWSVVKRAWETTLSNGVRLVTSADHRFLTDCGWTFVARCQHDVDPRPHLTPNTRLLGLETWLGARHIEGTAIECAATPTVVSIRDLGIEMPMYDITTATGDYVSNGVISHNCFARPTHHYLGLNIGEDFDSKIVVKINAVERLQAELASPNWRGDLIAMGTNTDPYQAAEGKYHLTRGIIGVLSQTHNPFSILTKSTLVLRDLPHLVAAATRTSVRLDFSIGTLDEAVWKLTEPGTPPPRRRVEAVRRLNEAGIPCGVLVAPVLPGLSDGDDQVREVVTACLEAGAVSVSAVALHLRPGVREHYFAWLHERRPELASDYARLFARGAYQPATAQARLSALVAEASTRVTGVAAPPDRRIGVGRGRRTAEGGPPRAWRPSSRPSEGETEEQLRLL